MTVSFDVFILAITTLIGFLTLTKSDAIHLKLLRFFLLVDLIFDITGYILSHRGIRNITVYNIYSLLELSFFLYFLRETIPGNGIKKSIRVLQFLLPSLSILNILFVQGVRQFQSSTFALGCLALVTLGVIYIYRLFKDKENINLLREPAFWVNVGVIFFFTSILSMMGIQNYMAKLPYKIILLLTVLVRIIASLFYIFLIIAFVCQRRTRR